MKKIILLSVFLLAGCQRQTKKDNSIKIDSVTYPLLIDSGRKVIYSQGADTVNFSKGLAYRQDALRHPLLQFYLSYPEWETIACIIAVDEEDYWDKAMIGLIEKTGNLRINYRGETLRLAPSFGAKMKEGQWTGTFKNDSIDITISGLLEKKRILRSLTGYGKLILKTRKQTIDEDIFMVYEKN